MKRMSLRNQLIIRRHNRLVIAVAEHDREYSKAISEHNSEAMQRAQA